MVEESRSPKARRLAEEALVRLIDELRREHQQPDLILLGGLVPALLVSGEDAPEHLGTNDVDLLVTVQLENTMLLVGLERSLQKAGFRPDPKIDGWRWTIDIAGSRVRVEFLCDDSEAPSPSVLKPDGCSILSIANLRGTGFVVQNAEEEELSAEIEGLRRTVRIRRAGLAGYLLAKMAAARERGADKDYYDFGYVLLYNDAGGPREAATEVARTFPEALPGVQSTLLEIATRYARASDAAVVSFVKQSLEVDQDVDKRRLAQDVISAVQEFTTLLRVN